VAKPGYPAVHFNAGVFGFSGYYYHTGDPLASCWQRPANSDDQQPGQTDPLFFLGSKKIALGDKEVGSSAVLDKDSQDRSSAGCRVPGGSGWSRQQKRAYQRILSGFLRNRGKYVRFLTLTSIPGMEVDLSSAFYAFKMRVRRLTVFKLVKGGYLDNNFSKFRYFYPGQKLIDPLTFEYVRVRSAEGAGGVLHVVFVGSFLPKRWVRDTWKELTGGAFEIDIQQVKLYKSRGLARYLVSQYLANQVQFYLSWSWGWVFKGFCKEWERLKRICAWQKVERKKVFLLWQLIVQGDISPPLCGLVAG